MSAGSDSLPRMTRPMRALRIVLLSAFLTIAAVASAGAATTIHFQSESLSALKVQLGHHEVHAVTFHPRLDE